MGIWAKKCFPNNIDCDTMGL